MSDVAWTVLAAVLMVLGLGGVVIPVLPGLALIWAVALGYGLIVGFGTIGTATMILLTALYQMCPEKQAVTCKFLQNS